MQHVSGKSRRRQRLNMETLEQRELLTDFDLLVFSKTAAFRHDSIATAVQTIEQLGADNNFSVTATEDATQFNASNLSKYEAVVFLLTTGDVLNSAQQSAFQQYIRAGGGFVGIHSAADTEYDWPWYGELVGAYFDSHPQFQEATIVVNDRSHPSTQNLPERWTRNEEWYNYRINPRRDVHVLLTVDETSYSGGNMGYDHPIAWTHEFDGGRAWYTGLGHSRGAYAEPRFRDHLLGGLQYAAGQVRADAEAAVDSSFDVTVLDNQTFDPMELAVAPDGRVVYIERGGAVKVYRPGSNDTVVAGKLEVYTEQEDGLLGLALDPNFSENQWIYLYYSPAGEVSRQLLSRFELNGEQLEMNSRRDLLEIPTQRDHCCHAGGSLAFGPDGSLFLSTGDDSNPFNSDGFAPLDERPFFTYQDAQRTSGNADDLRGKILRIVPEDDGTYSIPSGNLFPADGSAGRPEVFVMGARNPFRISVDAQNGWVYFGDVGPDAVETDPLRGPEGFDEVNQVREPGNFGWPYFSGDNQSYREYDAATGASGSSFDPSAPVNNSPNNTGPINLPPAQPAFIWYPGRSSPEFPELDGAGGRTSMAGPVFHYDPTVPAAEQLPAYYDNTLFIYEWSRNWIKEVKLDSDGNILKINPFLSSVDFVRPMDMELGPDGNLYLLEWGSSFRGGNTDSRLVRISYDHSADALPPIRGDFNGDGVVTLPDITLLCQAIHAPDQANEFDLSADGTVSLDDLGILVRDVLGTTAGDANLDRVFDSTDVVQVFQTGEYEDADEGNSDWSSGDWNCDSEFDTSDMVVAFQSGDYVQQAVVAAVANARTAGIRPPFTVKRNVVAAAVNDVTGTEFTTDRQFEDVRHAAIREHFDGQPARRLLVAQELSDRVFENWARTRESAIGGRNPNSLPDSNAKALTEV